MADKFQRENRGPQARGAEFNTYPLDDGMVCISLEQADGKGVGIVVNPQAAIEQIAVPIIKAAAAATALAMQEDHLNTLLKQREKQS